jgi:nicotinate-nucleotide adenylyltransferase
VAGERASRDRRALRIGVFGGSFDPVHVGHQHAALAAQERFDLDRVIFVPAAQPPHKPERRLAAGRDRLAMLELAIRGHRDWSLSTIELLRGGPSYTIDTLRALPTSLDLVPAEVELYLILGSDNLDGFASWKSVREILSLARPIVIYRGDDVDSALERVRESLPPELAAAVEQGFLRLPPVAASSSEIRAAFAEGRAPRDVLPPGVEEYIREHGIYGARPASAR